jgi:hypothetical protein
MREIDEVNRVKFWMSYWAEYNMECGYLHLITDWTIIY